MKEGKRSDRVGEQLRMEIADLLIRGKLRDSDSKVVIVSGVKVTDDLSIARVYVRVLGEADEARRGRVVRALQRAARHDARRRHLLGRRREQPLDPPRDRRGRGHDDPWLWCFRHKMP